jgi:serine/threonine protein kinase
MLLLLCLLLLSPLQVLHSDLKVRNVLLKSDGSSERGCVAKVADFGLAVKLETNHTHVSAFQVRCGVAGLVLSVV